MGTKKSKSWFLEQIRASDNPEAVKIAAQLQHDYEEGLIRDSPRTLQDCHDWQDAWLYSFQRARLDPDDHIKKQGDKVVCVVWLGVDFNDSSVANLKRIARRLGAAPDLEELRLIGTKVSLEGIERLRTLFPTAQITTYRREDQRANPRIGYADPTVAAKMFPERG